MSRVTSQFFSLQRHGLPALRGGSPHRPGTVTGASSARHGPWAMRGWSNAQARLRRPSAEALAAAPSGALSESRKSFLRFLSPHLPRSQATAHTTSQTLFQNSGRVHVQLSGSSSPHLVPETSRMQAGTLPASSRVLGE